METPKKSAFKLLLPESVSFACVSAQCAVDSQSRRSDGDDGDVGNVSGDLLTVGKIAALEKHLLQQCAVVADATDTCVVLICGKVGICGQTRSSQGLLRLQLYTERWMAWAYLL